MKNLMNTFAAKARSIASNAKTRLADRRGDLATNTIGGIIVAVVIIGLLIAAVNAFFPNFFSDMFTSMQGKLNANW